MGDEEQILPDTKHAQKQPPMIGAQRERDETWTDWYAIQKVRNAQLHKANYVYRVPAGSVGGDIRERSAPRRHLGKPVVSGVVDGSCVWSPSSNGRVFLTQNAVNITTRTRGESLLLTLRAAALRGWRLLLSLAFALDAADATPGADVNGAVV